jgi:hypothetical protein
MNTSGKTWWQQLAKVHKERRQKGDKDKQIDGDLGGTSFKKTLNPKVEQSRISNLDFETMQWQHVRAFDSHLMQKFNC